MVVSYVGPCAFIEEYSMLVIGDLHIGTDQDLSETGAFAPDISISNITKTLTAVIRKTKPDIIVVLGDIAIHFGKMPDRQRQNITTIIHRLKNSCKKLVLLKGNHDAYIAQYFKDTKTPFAEQYIYNEYFFCHGHEIPEIPDSCTTIFIGHEHPAISMTNSIRTE
ncbi:MAG: metallophosphoesterase [Candidatus Woesearchaeota archaeon]